MSRSLSHRPRYVDTLPNPPIRDDTSIRSLGPTYGRTCQRLKSRLVVAAVACLSVLACAQAVSLARSLSLVAYTQSQGARQAPSRCSPAAGAAGPAAGVLQGVVPGPRSLVAPRACRAVATGTVLCHGAALCAQRSALSAMINLSCCMSAPPMRKPGVV